MRMNVQLLPNVLVARNQQPNSPQKHLKSRPKTIRNFKHILLFFLLPHRKSSIDGFGFVIRNINILLSLSHWFTFHTESSSARTVFFTPKLSLNFHDFHRIGFLHKVAKLFPLTRRCERQPWLYQAPALHFLFISYANQIQLFQITYTTQITYCLSCCVVNMLYNVNISSEGWL